MATKRTSLLPGDVFIAKVPDGRYGAARILRIVERTTLVYSCDYLDANPPVLSDPSLCRCVIQNRFGRTNERAMLWLRGKPTEELVHLGNLPITVAEAAMECATYGGGWSLSVTNQAYLEWQFAHDRAGFERDRELRLSRDQERAKLASLSARPTTMMPETEFWRMIARLSWEHTGDDDQVLAPAVAALSACTKAQMHAFEERLSSLLYQLDTREHARHIGEESYSDASGYVSADWFLYVRCAAVANGRAVYEAAVKDPTRMPKDVEFEALLGLANAAHVARFDDEMDYAHGLSHESFSNKAGWS